jgi:glycosyltransferase involved in cell wall biosynthesis
MDKVPRLVESERPDLLIFELSSWGHIPNYLRLIIEYWHSHFSGGHLHFVIAPQLVQNHPAVLEDINAGLNRTITWSSITPSEEEIVRRFRFIENPQQGSSEGQNKSLFLWSLIQKYLRQLSPKHVLFLTLDDLLLPMCGGLKLGIDFSGIMFRPLFHYSDRWAKVVPALAHFDSLPQKLFINRFLNHPELRTAFFIDETIPQSISGKVRCEVVHLPDPVRLPASLPEGEAIKKIKGQLDVPLDRTTFLLFGDITKRKGIWNILDALESMSNKECSKIFLAIVGKAGPLTEARLNDRIQNLEDNKQVKILRQPAYVSDVEMQNWFIASDVILAVYRHHIGMSGIQLLAAAHQRPILSQDYGLMGALTKSRKLGRTCDPEDIQSLADSIRALLSGNLKSIWDTTEAAKFARQHSHERFAETLFKHMQNKVELNS